MGRLRYLTAGESHGPGLVGILEGMPAGLSVPVDRINAELARRQKGYGRGGRMKIETDRVRILGGLRGSLTLGSPIGFLIENRDFANWTDQMDPVKAPTKQEPVTLPRPGHADLSGHLKYRFDDMRNVLERASARETAMRVALGAVAKLLLEAAGAQIGSHVVAIGGIRSSFDSRTCTPHELNEKADKSLVRCPDEEATEAMVERIRTWAKKGESTGGIFEVVADGLPAGLGSHAQWDRRLDGRLSGAMAAIPAMKGVEIGAGFQASDTPGSKVHDPIAHDGTHYVRHSNNAGGIEGGIGNGERIRIRVAMKPIPTLSRPLPSVDIHSKEEASAHFERTDKCAVPAAAVVGEAVAALVLADALLEKTGGDSMEEIESRLKEMRDWETRA